MACRLPTMLPPAFAADQSNDSPLAEHRCLACHVFYALADSPFCGTCKEDAQKERMRITSQILQFEQHFNVGFELMFSDDAAFFGDNPVSYGDPGLNTIPTAAQVLEFSNQVTIPDIEWEKLDGYNSDTFIDVTDDDIIEDIEVLTDADIIEVDGIETHINPEDMSLRYKCGETDTDDYVRGLVDEIAACRMALETKRDS